MAILDLLVRFIQAVAWPVTVLIIVALIRKPLVALIPALQKLKFKELELEFREKLSEDQPKMVALANAREEEKPEEKQLTLHPASYYEEIARISQRAAILEAWIEVEAAASEAFIKRAKPGMRVFVAPREALDFLASHEVIDSVDLKRAQVLRELRNKAGHETDMPSLSSDVVANYIQSCLALATKLKRNAA